MFREKGKIALVPFPICFQLRGPKVQLGFRESRQRARRICVSVPKTAVYEDYLSSGRKDQVGLPGQVTTMKPVAIAQTMHEAAHQQLGLGVSAAYPAHALASLFWR
jgi:hypothetical protein